MLNKIFVLGFMFSLAGINSIFAALPVLNSGEFIADLGSFSTPTSVDWNNDGKLDFIVGDSTGYIRYYENKGSADAPSFSTYVNIQANGAVIDVPDS